MTVRLLCPLVLLATTAFALAGRSGAEQPPPGPPPSAAGDTARYCALVGEVNGIGERVFSDLPDDAPPEETGRRQGLLVQQAAAQLAEMQQAAPPEIRSDVAVFVRDLSARSTSPQGPDPAAAEAAEQRILEFEARSCPGGGAQN